MTSGNIKKLYVLYWKHSREDRQNSFTNELRDKLWYDKRIEINTRKNEMDFRFMNCNKNTEDYVIHRDAINLIRRHKVTCEPLVYVELYERNKDGRMEDMVSVNGDHNLNKAINMLDEYIRWDEEK
jgi:hypothetical protein